VQYLHCQLLKDPLQEGRLIGKYTLSDMEGGYFYYVENKRLSVTMQTPTVSSTGLLITDPQPSVLAASSRYRKTANYPQKNLAHNFVFKHGRRYAGDESIPYPLPNDHRELNRQNIRHLLYYKLFGSHHAAEFKTPADIPSKVLDVGCGSALWCADVADEFAARGRPDVQFIGLDVVPIQPDLPGANFTYVQHNLLNGTLPFESNSFDYVFARELSMCIPNTMKDVQILDEYLRVLKKGGTLEIQASDHTIRSLRPSTILPSPTTGAYSIMPTTAFNLRAENIYIQAWNQYTTEMLMRKNLSAVPCTLIHTLLLGSLFHIQNKRFALPLDEIWEETFPPVNSSLADHDITIPVTPSTTPQVHPDTPPPSVKSKKDSLDSVSSVFPDRTTTSSTTHTIGPPSPPDDAAKVPSTSSTIDTAAPPQPPPHPTISSTTSNYAIISDEAKALRLVARQNFTELAHSLEPVLREANHLSENEWENWYYGMMENFFQERGLRNGECMEFGAWWGIKAQA